MKRLNYFLLFNFIAWSMVSVSSIDAAETEAVFQAANQYTVKISTSVMTPFDEDSKGTFTGTGFLVDASRGWILTNAHVASRSPSSVRISFKGDEYMVAEKLYIDPLIDVAILQIPLSKLPSKVKPAPLQCKNMPKAGTSVGAFGHPWGFNYTATMGIVSGYTYKWGMYLMQTDAPVNHGNSGGPLISVENGKVVGITTAKLDKASAKRMNFAVPAKYACKIISLLKQDKDPSPPDLPIVFFDDENKGKTLNVAKVYTTSSHYPLQSGDEILQVDNGREQLSNPGVLVHQLRGNVNKVVRIGIKRGKQKQTIKFHVQPMKKIVDHQGIYVSGLIIADVPYVDKQEFALEHMLMVHDVEAGSVAEGLKIESSDFLISVNNKSYQNVNNLYLGLKKLVNTKIKAHLIVKRLYLQGTNLFSYHEVDLPVSKLRFIGPLH